MHNPRTALIPTLRQTSTISHNKFAYLIHANIRYYATKLTPTWPRLLTLSGALALGAHQVDHALVHLDAGDHVPLLEELHERGAVVGLLVEGLVEQNHAGDVVADRLVGGEQQLKTARVAVRSAAEWKWH